MRDVLEDVAMHLHNDEYEEAGERVTELQDLAHCPLCETVARQMNTGVLYVLNSPEGRRPVVSDTVAEECNHYVSTLNDELDGSA